MRTLLAAWALAGLSACTTLRGPELGDLPAVEPLAQPPVILVPGLLASRLRDPQTGRRLWPPNLAMLIGGWRMRDLAMPVPYDPGARSARLTPAGLVLSRPRRDYYASLLDALAEVGYECVPARQIDAGTTCVLLAWDWRRGFVAAAGTLERVVDELRKHRDDPTLEVDLIGHSAGALVARYYAGFGGADVVDTAAAPVAARAPSAVRRLVLIGPPNEGTVFGAQRLIRGYALGVFTVQPEVLATFESAYQLLPAPERDWLVDIHGEPVQRDLYAVDTWRELEVSIFDPAIRERVASRFETRAAARARLRALESRFGEGLERGRRFQRALSLAADAGRLGADFLVLGSDCERTPRYLLVERIEGREVLRLYADEIATGDPAVDYAALLGDPGDGRVTRASMLSLGREPATGRRGNPSGGSFALVCERHSEMTSNPRIQRATLEFLLE